MASSIALTWKESTVRHPSKHPSRHLRAAVAAMVLGLAALGAAAESPQTLTPVTENKSAPDLALKMVDGGTLKLSDLRGKVVVVNFWDTWCPPCRQEMPSLERLKGLMKGEALEIVAINAGEDEDAIAEFRQAIKPALTFTIALDPKAEAMKAFSVTGLPSTFVIDRQGHVAYRALGRRIFDDPAIVGILKALAAK
jgi:thiol-disulfide isomerase/thioredoxin